MMPPAVRLKFSDLTGWEDDDHAAAMAAFLVTADLYSADWNGVTGADAGDARKFFEALFCPMVLGAPPALFTGYFEPELAGALRPGKTYRHALYGPPAELTDGEAWHSRAEIERGDLLAGQELVYLADPVDAFFAQVQGSARVRLEDGRILRLGHAAKNGHPYRSIGAELVRQKQIAPDRISAQAIRDWLATHPDRRQEFLWHNPSFVFFRRIDLPDEAGPLGTMGRSVSALRSIAVDPAHIPLGAPVWIETETVPPIRSLMIAQDTGSAIKGAQRADIFFGSGAEAGARAGTLKSSGRMVVLVPKVEAEGAVP